MSIPDSPPRLRAAVAGLSPERLVAVVSRSDFDPEPGGRYLHWDDLRHRPPPEGLTPDEWWISIKFARRAAMRRLPLNDQAQNPFGFVRTDSLYQALHLLDRDAGIQAAVADPLLAQRDLRERYLVRSLIEEAITSSQLEGASTTRKVAKEMLLTGRPPRSLGEKMIANNYRAMEFVRDHLQEPLTVALLFELHRVLTDGTLDEPAGAGRFRRGDESVVVQDRADGSVLHVPPPADGLPGRMDALLRFANSADPGAFVHPIVRAIVLHFALAYEHPFIDGNGRTARALFYWSMLRSGYWLTELLSISRVLKKAPAQYGRAFLLTETDEADLTYFLLHQLHVLRTAVSDLHAYLERKAEELREADELIRETDALNHRQRALVSDALRKPNSRYTVEAHRRQHRIVYETARTDLLGLVDAGYLQKRQVGRGFQFAAVPDLEQKLKRGGR